MSNEPSTAKRPRRRALRILLVVVALLVAGAGGLGIYYLQASVDTIGEVDFSQRLAIPPIAGSRVDAAGTRVFDLDIRAGETRFLDGPATKTAGVNGTFLGPTIRAHRGENVAFNVHNGLGEPTSLHWHGMHVPAAMDGGPHQMVAPGDVWSPKWTVAQPAATLWYHPHLHGKTAEHAYRGVSGMFILDDDDTAALNLPDTYGVDDVPVIVQDRTFDDDDNQSGRSSTPTATRTTSTCTTSSSRSSTSRPAIRHHRCVAGRTPCSWYRTKKYRLAMRFSDYSDPDSPYMYHCHLLTHEDEGMMGQFVVLGDGEEIGGIPRHDHPGHDHP